MIKKEFLIEPGNIINNKYILEKYLDYGGYSYVYKVKDIKDNKIYALKLFIKNGYSFENEIKINKIINELKNPFCIKFIDSSIYYLVKGEVKSEHPYIILEYASKGSVLNYLKYNYKGLNEKLCKFLFSKIIKIVKSLHNMGICHRDLKLENFLFDGNNFTIKISDFGLSSQIIKDKNGIPQKLSGEIGSKFYKAPEIYLNKSYDGEKADIFSLGVILFNLRTGKFGFKKATNDDILYTYIREGKIDSYWKIIGKYIDISDLSEDFKKLFIKIVSYNPKNRPNIEEIYNDSWLKEIRDLNQNEIKEYEQYLIEELKSRE